jgi:tRNA dimethylallyltransferase
MDLGTGKDLAEYGGVPYHLIDIVDPVHEFSVFEFQKRFVEAFLGIRGRGRLSLLVGGTGLYLEVVLRGYRLPEVPPDEKLRENLASFPLPDLAERLRKSNPLLHNTTDLLDRERLIRAIEIAESKVGEQRALPGPELEAAVFGIRWPREILHQRILRRLRERIDQGLIDEARKLHQSGVSFERLDFFGLEYRYAAMHLKGQINKNDMFQKLGSAIRQFAKRQETWFRRMERQGVRIRWVEGGEDPAGTILEMLKSERLLVDS